MNQLSLESMVRRHPEHVAAEMDGEVVMMNTDTGMYFALNEVASFIWNQLSEPQSLQRICDCVLAEFDVTPEACDNDTRKFVESMVTDGLLVVDQPAPAKLTIS